MYNLRYLELNIALNWVQKENRKITLNQREYKVMN